MLFPNLQAPINFYGDIKFYLSRGTRIQFYKGRKNNLNQSKVHIFSFKNAFDFSLIYTAPIYNTLSEGTLQIISLSQITDSNQK